MSLSESGPEIQWTERYHRTIINVSDMEWSNLIFFTTQISSKKHWLNLLIGIKTDVITSLSMTLRRQTSVLEEVIQSYEEEIKTQTLK